MPAQGLTTEVEIETGEPITDHHRFAVSLPFVKSVQGNHRSYTFEVENPTINVPNLVRALVDDAVKVYAVRPKIRDLEAIYLQCLSEGGVER